ncbi:hypothetical protein BKA83DRAFT_4223302 [Pisolithus microcarpus]|nr:hypothetical protein BKA83DRAFT_4223302 [Pisolithus microcarpus]
MASPHNLHRPGPGTFSSFEYPIRRRSPSPKRHAYDSYVPHGGALYREDYASNYRPNKWRPQNYSRSPSPGLHDRPRAIDSRPWEQGSRRTSSYYPDRRSPPASPRLNTRRDTMAERMFESDTWAHQFTDRSGRYDPSDSTSDRRLDRRAQFTRDQPPHKPAARTDFAHNFTGDSYRPHPGAQGSRDLHPYPRTADTYRPHYDDESWRQSYSTDSLSSTVHRGRRLDYEDDYRSSSIASTPPRQYARSPTSPPHQSTQPLARDGSAKSSTRRTPTSYGTVQLSPEFPPYTIPPLPYRRHTPDFLVHQQHQLPSTSFVYQQTSQVLGEQPSYKMQPLHHQWNPQYTEPPRRTIKSRSSSPSSRASGQAQSAISESRMELPPDPASIRRNDAAPQDDMRHSTDMYDQNILEEDSSNQGVFEDPSSTQSGNHETVHVANGLLGRCANRDLHLPSPVTPILASADNTTAQEPPEHGVGRVDGSSMEMCPLKESSQEPLPGGDATKATEPLMVSEGATKPSGVSFNSDEREQLPSFSAVTPPPVFQVTEKPVPSITAIGGLGVGLGIIPPQLGQSLPHIVVSDHSATRTAAPKKSRLNSQRQSGELTSVRDGLRLVVLARLRCDRQTRDERVYPLLRANQVVSELQRVPVPLDDQSRLFEEVVGGGRLREWASKHQNLQPAFVEHFAKRQSEIFGKACQLKEEYLALHERWLEHCARLDEEQKSGVTEEVAVPSGGRSTRRSTAILGDAVRSDLEMEQIIASLGVEELTDPSYLAIKNVAKIPDMVSVTHGSIPYLFDDTNSIIDNPAEFYGACSGNDYWAEEERSIFLTEFAAHPKQFGIIAERLPNKTPAQCVTYYYLQKKQGVDFRKAVMQYGVGRRRRNGRNAKQRGNALLADIRRHDDEVSRGSSAVTSNGTSGKRKRTINGQNGEPKRTATCRRAATQPDATPASAGTTPDPDLEPPRRRRKPAASRLVIDKADNDTITKESEGRPLKRGRKSRTAPNELILTPSEEPLTPLVVEPTSEDPEGAIALRAPFTPSAWTQDDKSADHYFTPR